MCQQKSKTRRSDWSFAVLREGLHRVPYKSRAKTCLKNVRGNTLPIRVYAEWRSTETAPRLPVRPEHQWRRRRRPRPAVPRKRDPRPGGRSNTTQRLLKIHLEGLLPAQFAAHRTSRRDIARGNGRPFDWQTAWINIPARGPGSVLRSHAFLPRS
jgi:hypothetical protein